MNISFTEDQIEELKAMCTASKIRMNEWIKEAKAKGNDKEANHLACMLEKRTVFEKHILTSVKAAKAVKS